MGMVSNKAAPLNHGIKARAPDGTPPTSSILNKLAVIHLHTITLLLNRQSTTRILGMIPPEVAVQEVDPTLMTIHADRTAINSLVIL